MVNLSIIVPVYNTCKYLEKCVFSILSQNYDQFELILVDDGSTDGSAEMCDYLYEKDSRIQVVHQDNKGAIRARMNGVSQSSGTYITFIDSDDYVENNYISMFMDALNEVDVDIIIGTYVLDIEGKTEKVFDGSREGMISKDEATLRMFQKNGYDWSGVGKVYRKELLKELDDWWTYCQYGEDTEMNWKLFRSANSFYYIPANGYHYYVHQSSIMRNITPDIIAYFSRIERIINALSNDDICLHHAINLARLREAEYDIGLLKKGRNTKTASLIKKIIEYSKSEHNRISSMIYDSIDFNNRIHNYSNELCERCSSHDGIILYGAGRYAELAYKLLKIGGCDLKSVVVSQNQSKNGIFHDITIEEINYNITDNNYCIILALRDEQDAINNLQNLNVSNERIIRCGEFFFAMDYWNY